MAVPAALKAYSLECERIGASLEHIQSIGLLRERVMVFQERNGSRVPDTIGDELARCLEGKGID
jgi:hypothetical protein